MGFGSGSDRLGGIAFGSKRIKLISKALKEVRGGVSTDAPSLSEVESV
jgi:hypothetical protein